MQEILDWCHGANILSMLDLKAGYHNIEYTERTKNLLGIAMQEGLCHWERMPFGPHATPQFFQYIINALLSDLLGLRSYLDDLKTQGFTWYECWQ